MKPENYDGLVRLYIKGKSYDELVEWIKEDGYKENIQKLLQEIDIQYFTDRKKVAQRDLYFVLSVFGSAILFGLEYIFNVNIIPDAVFFVSLIAWIPFFKSYRTVKRDEHKFQKQDEKKC